MEKLREVTLYIYIYGKFRNVTKILDSVVNVKKAESMKTYKIER